MIWHLPADEAELREALVDGGGPGDPGAPGGSAVVPDAAGGGAALTGAPDASALDPALRREAEASALRVISTAAPSFRSVVSFEPRDQVVTVGAGLRLSALDEVLAAEEQWIPAAAAAPARTVGGLVAAAPVGPYDDAFGPLRRQLLACRVITHRGDTLRWGRPVVKDVAGYDMKGLWCGSRGRLGALVEATFRTWPRPAVVRRYRIYPAAEETEPGETAAGEEAAGEAEAKLGLEAGRLTGGEWFRPDALVWSWTAASGAALRAELRGSAASVEEREEILLRWARSRGAEITAEKAEETEKREPGRRAGEPDRPAAEAVLAFRTLPGRLPELLAAVSRTAEAGEAAGRAIRLEAYPLAGTARLVYRRGREPEVRATDALAATAIPFSVAVERGRPEEHRAAEARRSPDARALEGAVDGALGMRPREWLADYL